MMPRTLVSLLIALLLMFTAGCSARQSAVEGAGAMTEQTAVMDTVASSTMPEEDNSLDDYDDYSAEDEALNADPLEGWNRFWFDVNDWLLQNILKPAHKGYVAVVPEGVRGAVSNFRHNLAFPMRMMNFLLQGEFAQAGVEMSKGLGNFMVTLGFGDVTSRNEVLVPYYPEAASFDHTLGVWGLPDGPYFIIPFMGPSTIRGAFGEAGDAAMKPQNYMIDDWYVTLGADLYLRFNDVDKQYKAYDQITESALEPYVALRSAYLSMRKNRQERLDAAESH